MRARARRSRAGNATLGRYLKDNSFALLQGSRMRNTKTEFVSCPSCGRTLFDLQEVTAQISEKTGHLPGVAIAIMGCIVNGPGEMADADFGYVGGAPGKVDLYVGKTVVQRGIPNEIACDALVELIKEHGMWKDKEDEPEEDEPVDESEFSYVPDAEREPAPSFSNVGSFLEKMRELQRKEADAKPAASAPSEE